MDEDDYRACARAYGPSYHACMGLWAREEYPGWFRCFEYIPRSYEICRKGYYEHYPGYKRAVELARPSPAPPEKVQAAPCLEKLRKFKSDYSFVGTHNREDVERGFKRIDFPKEARPWEEERIAKDGHQLFALCKEVGVNHLIHVGFAINWCLLLSPGGTWDMSTRGFMCSTIKEATTAVENKEGARKQLCKELAL